MLRLQRFSIVGIHLGMTHNQILKVLRDSLGAGVTLKKTPNSNDRVTYYNPVSSDKDLKYLFEQSQFVFEGGERLTSIYLDMKVIMKMSGLEMLETDAFAQQAMRKYGVSHLEANRLPRGGGGVNHLAYEAFVDLGEKCVRVCIGEIKQPSWSPIRYLTLSFIDRLSFGPKGSLFGLKFGMTKSQTLSVLKRVFGKKTRFIKSENFETRHLPKSLVAYGIQSGENTVGPTGQSFVVFGNGGKLREVFFSSDQLERVTSCRHYHHVTFGQIFMSHFGLKEMDTTTTSDLITYKYKSADDVMLFEFSRYTRFSVYVFLRPRVGGNKAKF